MAVDKLVDSTQLDADLTSVADAIRTKGGTSADLAFPAGFVSAVQAIPTGGGGNDDAFLSGTFNGETITSNVTKLGYVFQRSSGSVYVVMPELTTMSGQSLAMSSSIVTFFAPKAVISAAQVFSGSANLTHAVISHVTAYTTFLNCSNLEAVDMQSSSGQIDNLFQSNCGKMATLILRGNGVATLKNLTAFAGSPFKSGGTGGTLYVPSSLISSYQSATNWSTILGYATNSIQAIEGSQYENYYADGTPIT